MSRAEPVGKLLRGSRAGAAPARSLIGITLNGLTFMPNGKPGNHPITDMLVHGSPSTYPEDIFAQVKRLAAMPGFDTVEPQVANILWENWPYWSNVTPDLDKVRRTLRELTQSLQSGFGNPPTV